MHEQVAFVVSFILSGRSLTVRAFLQQVATAHREAVLFYRGAGNYESCRKGKDGEREGVTRMERVCRFKRIPN